MIEDRILQAPLMMRGREGEKCLIATSELVDRWSGHTAESSRASHCWARPPGACRQGWLPSRPGGSQLRRLPRRSVCGNPNPWAEPSATGAVTDESRPVPVLYFHIAGGDWPAAQTSRGG